MSVPVVRADAQGATAESSLPGVKAEHGAEAAAKLRGVRVHINAASGAAVQPGAPCALHLLAGLGCFARMCAVPAGFLVFHAGCVDSLLLNQHFISFGIIMRQTQNGLQ